MEDKICYCFLDTNTFLHYQTITDINWTEELGVSQVVLVVCSTVIRELDKKKTPDNRKNIRERARNAISKMSEIQNGNKMVRSNVKLLLLNGEPIIDWQEEALDNQIEDDRIIAAVICKQRKDPTLKGNSIIVTHDFGFQLKADNRGIKCHDLSEKYLLPDIKSPEEEELDRLRKENDLLKNSLPKLDLGLLIEENSSKFGHFCLQRHNPLSPEIIESELSEIRKKMQYKYNCKDILTEVKSPSYGSIYGSISPAEIERYHDLVDEYIDKMRIYRKEMDKYDELLSRTLELRFILTNNGTAPAEDIDIFLYFPDGFDLYNTDEIYKKPKMPEKPVPPRNLLEMLKDSYQISQLSVNSFLSELPSINIDKPIIKKTNSYEVRYGLPKFYGLKHGMNRNLDPIYLTFPTLESVKSFHIDYKISVGNHPEGFTGKIDIKVSFSDQS